MTIGEWLQKQRTRKGWSQEHFAHQLKVNRSAVAQWESGTTRPHRLRLTDLVGILETSIPEKIVKATWG